MRTIKSIPRFSLLLFSALQLHGFIAQANEFQSGYILEAIHSDVGVDGYKNALGLRAGVSFYTDNAAVEGTFTNIGKFSLENGGIEVEGFELTGSKPIALLDNFSIAPTIGAYRWQAKATNNAKTQVGHDQGLSVTYGARMVYLPHPNLALRLAIQKARNVTDSDITEVSAGCSINY